MTWLLLTVAAVGLVWAWRTSSPQRRTILGIIAAGGLWFQAFHMLEHVALTLSVIVAGRAVGVTTLFGTLEPGPTLWSLRVLAHLSLNATATLFAAMAVIQIATRPNERVAASDMVVSR